MRVPVILRVYTSLLVPVAGCGRFWAGLVALENNENSKGSFFDLSGPTYRFGTSPVSADAFAGGGGIALLRALADDKKARNGLRWLMAAAYKAGYEPRVGNISLYKLQPSTTSSSPAVEPEEPCTQATGRKRRRKRKRKRQAELDGLAGSDAEMQEQECTDVPPAPSSLSPVLETDHATQPEPQRIARRDKLGSD